MKSLVDRHFQRNFEDALRASINEGLVAVEIVGGKEILVLTPKGWYFAELEKVLR